MSHSIKKLFTAALAFCFTTFVFQVQAETSERAAAKELVAVTLFQDSFKDVLTSVTNALYDTINDEDEDDMPSKEEFANAILEVIDLDELSDALVNLYNEVYTEEELQGLLEFYQSEVGQRFLSKTPLLLEKGLSAFDQIGKKWADKIESALTE